MWVGTNEVTGIYLGTQSVKKIYRGTEVLWEEPSDCPCLCFTANTAGSTVKLYDNEGYDAFTRDFKYSRNGRTWISYPYAHSSSALTITLANVGDKVYFKGDNPEGLNTLEAEINCILRFTMTGSISASGNIMSLIDDGDCAETVIPNIGCFNYIFRYCESLTTPPSLPATELKSNCYQNMFLGCTSLQSVPLLPATSISGGAYQGMFYGCTSLIVSDNAGSGYSNAWRIPSGSGTFTSRVSESSMFNSCAGTRSSDNLVAEAGGSCTYYTQNTPV